MRTFASELPPLDSEGREGIAEFAHAVDAWGRTALVPAMRIVMLQNPRRIVLLSDGLGNVGGYDAELLRDAREAMRGGTRIDTISLGSGHDAMLLRTLAAESGGLYQAF